MADCNTTRPVRVGTHRDASARRTRGTLGRCSEYRGGTHAVNHGKMTIVARYVDTHWRWAWRTLHEASLHHHVSLHQTVSLRETSRQAGRKDQRYGQPDS